LKRGSGREVKIAGLQRERNARFIFVFQER
jgi:hypothetical protein